MKTKSDLVCQSCGLCLGAVFVSLQFYSRDYDEMITLQPIHSFGTTLGNHRERNKHYNKLQRVNKQASHEKTSKAKIYDKMRRAWQILQIPQQIFKLAFTRYLKIHNEVKAYKSVIAATCLLIEIRQHQIPVTLRQIVKAFKKMHSQVSMRAINRCMIQHPFLRQALKPSKVETYLPKAMDLAIQHLAQRSPNGFDEAMARVEILATVQELLATADIKPGRHAKNVAASAVYAACQLKKYALPQKALTVDEFVCGYTLREIWTNDFRSVVQEAQS